MIASQSSEVRTKGDAIRTWY